MCVDAIRPWNVQPGQGGEADDAGCESLAAIRVFAVLR